MTSIPFPPAAAADSVARNEPPLVRAYLAHILDACQELSANRNGRTNTDEFIDKMDRSDPSGQPLESETNDDLSAPSDRRSKLLGDRTAGPMVAEIARHLLMACRVSTLLQPCPDETPKPGNDDDDDMDCEADQEESDDDDKDERAATLSPPAPLFCRRLDAVRLLLRAMAPIALDVVAHACSIVASSITETATIEANTTTTPPRGDELLLSSFVLLATWIPIASQIVPLVSGLFALSGFVCPMILAQSVIEANSVREGETSPTERPFLIHLLIAQAAHQVCRVYVKRREEATLTTWWDWSPIFRWIHCYRRKEFQNDDTNAMIITEKADETTMEVETPDVNAGDTITIDLDEIVDDENGEEMQAILSSFSMSDAIRFHAVRVASFVLRLTSFAKRHYYKRNHVYLDDTQVPNWVMPHPWELDHEETVYQQLYLNEGKPRQPQTKIVFLTRRREVIVDLPTGRAIRDVVPLHHYLVHIGDGILLVKHHPFQRQNNTSASTDSNSSLVRTATTAQNLTRVGVAMCIDPNPPPILLCGPHGSGKSSLIRELACMVVDGDSTEYHNGALLEIHVDEETDTKTLVGSYTASDIPGEFEWRPGALTQAVRSGQWTLIEDIDSVPLEIQASLVQLLGERLLPLGNGKTEHCHPNFRLFGTLTSDDSNSSSRGSSGKRILHPDLWQVVDIEPLPLTELKEIALELHRSKIPEAVIDATLQLFQKIDQSGRAASLADREEDGIAMVGFGATYYAGYGATCHVTPLSIGRQPSVRDILKVLSRISHGILFEKDATFITEGQRTLCMAETYDVFAAASADPNVRRAFLQTVAAPIWGISPDLAVRYVESRSPPVNFHESCTEIGRAKILTMRHDSRHARTLSETFFATTDYTLRMMEQLAVCIRENEPVLLVGETGCGKTSLLQQVAKVSGRELVVQNLSLQTDSTDLLGGFRPLEIPSIATKVYQEFVDLFVSSFSKKQNAEFLAFASTALKKQQWKKLSQCFLRAANLGLAKVKERESKGNADTMAAKVWMSFRDSAERFEKQRLASDCGMAFAFMEGALVTALRHGQWVLLDEINLASSETLQRICGLLDDPKSSLTLTERGDAFAMKRHSEFRLFAAMNPATDAGKKDLTVSVRSRFTELFVDELLDPAELRQISAHYISSVLPASDKPPEYTDTVIAVVEMYLKCRDMANKCLTDGSGQKPRYTLRTLARALNAARTLAKEQRLPLKRTLVEGFELAFEGPLDESSLKVIRGVLREGLGASVNTTEIDHPGRRPESQKTKNSFVLIKPFWIKAGSEDPIDWSTGSDAKPPSFILTPTVLLNLRRLARAVASGPWPVLLEGPTSAGKTTLIEYLGARCGHKIVRINNHEHTDIQEYTGGFAADSSGSLSFQDGLLTRALRLGHWVILGTVRPLKFDALGCTCCSNLFFFFLIKDELNLAPTEVLEALNRLLDDNRELYLSETNEILKPHPNFRLFATQNPSGAYGGRKPLSRAFRNRFVELHVGDIPSTEMVQILEQRCSCPRSHAKLLVSTMESLRHRRSNSSVFLGKDGFITPRDLLRWASRRVSSKEDLGREGYMLLAERLRTEEEKRIVKREIERGLNVTIDIDSFYYRESSESRRLLEEAIHSAAGKDSHLSKVALTKSLLRLSALVLRCIQQKEPVLLVGGAYRAHDFIFAIPFSHKPL